MTGDLEAVISDLDPARRMVIPEADLSEARRIRSTRAPVGRHPAFTQAQRFALRLGALGAGAVVAVVVLVVTLLPGGPGTAPEAGAAQQLVQLATVAGDQAPLGPGQYAYREVLQPVYQAPASAFNAYLEGTVQTWTATDGSGRQVVTLDPTPRFHRAADRAAWLDAGSPPLGNLATSSVTSFGPGRGSPAEAEVPVLDEFGLPTDPAVLGAELQDGSTGIPAVDDLGPARGSTLSAGNSCGSTACAAFVRAVALLEGPALGASPALQAAVYQALAGLPGVRALGTVSQGGRSGDGFALLDVLPGHVQACGDASSVTVPPVSSTYQVVVDPRSAALVATGVSFSAVTVPSCPGPGSAPSAPASTELLPSWTVVRSTGVVGSPTATPGGAGTG